MKALGVNGTVSLSLAFYNTQEEIEALFPALQKVDQIFSGK
jgi:selenocysteine lyase/cysteine desulfurase